ncbi:MAG: glycoside hydrolase family 172 protein [Acidobacteriota bacterium]
MFLTTHTFLAAVLLLTMSADQKIPPIPPSDLGVTTVRASHTARISSWDKTGNNRDWIQFAPGKEKTLADISGPGTIRHFYFTSGRAGLLLRELVLRVYWDGEKTPSVEVPIGDFFLCGHATVRHIRTTWVTVNTGRKGLGGHGFNFYLPMPFNNGARITIENQGKWESGAFWYHIEYETYDSPLPDDVGRFHASWRREPLTVSNAEPDKKNRTLWGGQNRDGRDNYVILEAEGKGQLVGLLLNVDNIRGAWYGEGDDMIFIDGQEWPPAYHGTGTEEIFGGGPCPNEEYAGPYTGFHFTENKDGKDFLGKVSMFRWFVHDPVRFQKSVKWTIEHGHANNYENDYSSVAYWYQLEPHRVFPPLPTLDQRLPRMPEAYFKANDAMQTARRQFIDLKGGPPEAFARMRRLRDDGSQLLEQGKYEEALAKFEEHRKEVERLKTAPQ